MATPVYLKSSSVTSKVPTTSTLSLRELGINTTDGILYLRQGTGVAGDNIIPVNPWKPGVGNTTAYNTYFNAGNVGIGLTNPTTALQVSGTITATKFVGDGSGLTGVVAASGIIIQNAGSTIGTAATINFTNYLNTTFSSGVATVGVAATSISTGNSIVARDASGNFATNAITISSGTTASPALNFSTGTSTGIYSPATNTLGISTAGVEAARIDASGNVGIGTTGVDKLTVLGRIQLQQDAGSNNRIVFRGTPGSSYRWSMDNYQSGNTFRIFREDDTTAANGYTALSLSSSGYLNGQIVGLGSGLYPAQQYYRLNSGLTGANSTAVQLPFGVSVTLAASTIYEFESYYILTKSSGTGSHTFSTGFTGTATVNNIISESLYFISTTALPPLSVNANSSNVAVGAGNAYGDKFTWTGALTATTITHVVLTKGTVSISTGGSFSPYYQLSGAPGTGYTAAAGSYYRIYPVGASGSNISIGTWA